jgi:hypothetical protein
MLSSWIVLAGMCLIWIGFIVWTLRRLGSKKLQDDVASKFGINRFGIITWVVVTVVVARMTVQNVPRSSLVLCVCYYGFILLPICLWAGFFWGKGMSALYPAKRKK